MPFLAIPFPAIDPVFFSIGPLPVRWYGLAYVFGLLLGWLYARRLVSAPALWGETPRPTAQSLDDLLVYSALGAIVGGRLFNVLFYGLDYYIVSAFTVADICGAVAPIGIFFGRIANFIKPEMWGRPSDVRWAVLFPGVAGARHPSQLYEAGLEGLVLLVVTAFVIRAGGFRRPGLVAGVFGVGYGLARTVSEFFREPDPQLEALAHGLTMGMVLSLPMIVIGLWLIVRSRGAKP